MQILITHSSVAPGRVLHFSRWQLVVAATVLVVVLVLTSGAAYHFLFIKASRDGWPVVGQIVRWVVSDDLAERERYLQHNLDAMAQRVGELQARVTALQVLGERVSGLAGLEPEDLQPQADNAAATSGGAPPDGEPGQIAPGGQGGQGGPSGRWHGASAETLADAVAAADEAVLLSTDIFTLIESRLMEARLQALLVPSARPVEVPFGSRFGFRIDPFNGRRALHTGLDFPAPVGTPVHAAAGGVVLAAERHPEYGTMLTLDHGNGLTTRYAHLSRILVEPGDLVTRAQTVAEVGNTGRSTGPHLHFEVRVDGVPQNPKRFLAGR